MCRNYVITKSYVRSLRRQVCSMTHSACAAMNWNNHAGGTGRTERIFIELRSPGSEAAAAAVRDGRDNRHAEALRN